MNKYLLDITADFSSVTPIALIASRIVSSSSEDIIVSFNCFGVNIKSVVFYNHLGLTTKYTHSSRFKSIVDKIRFYAYCKRTYNTKHILKLTWYNDFFESLLLNKILFRAKYTVILVDPISNMLKTNKLKRERIIVTESVCYFVPYSFYEDYLILCSKSSRKIYSYYVPMLETDFYEPKLNNREISIVHMGNLSQNRLSAVFKLFLDCSPWPIHAYSQKVDFISSNLKYHDLVNYSDMFKELENYSILLIADNTGYYKKYLATKALTYMSTGKPIVVFGEGGTACEKLLQDYPLSFYCKSETQFDDLISFIKLNFNKKVKKQVLNKYLAFSPIKSTRNLFDSIAKCER